MYAPFYKVYLEHNNRDISEYISTLRYEDCSDEDSLLELSVRSDYALTLADDTDFTSGVIILFHFGYIGGEISETHKAKITDIDYTYAGTITMKVKALSVGNLARKITDTKIWKGVTSSQIAEEIAKKYGLETDIQETSQVWDNLPQGNKSDMRFLRYLADRESDGKWVTYIRNSKLYFTSIGTDKESSKTFTYGDDKGTVVSFKPSYRESNQSADTNKVVIPKFNPYTAQTEPTVVDKKDATGGTLGNYNIVDANGKVVGTKQGKTTQQVNNVKGGQVKNFIAPPVISTEEAKNKAKSKQKANTLKILTSKLVVNGSPNLVPNSVITMAGVAKIHSGNWLVKKVTHDITTSGYLTTLDSDKNGVTSSGKVKNTTTTKKVKDANTTTGPEKAKKEVKLVKVNANGKRVP